MTKNILRAALLSTALAGIAGAASAAGTAPGQVVTNTIDLTYSSGGTTIQRPAAATVTFKVDRKVDFALAGQDASQTVSVEQGSTGQVMVWRLENEGNDISGYDLTVTQSGSVNLTYDKTGSGAKGTYSVYVGTSATDSAGDVLYDTDGVVSIGNIAADGVRFIKIKANFPDTIADGSKATFELAATALNAGTTTPTTMVRGQGLDGVDTILVNPSPDGKGIEKSSEEYIVSAPKLTASKTLVVVSENFNGNFACATAAPESGAEAAIPGACIEYTISVSNAADATSSARDLTIADVLPSDITYRAIYANNGFTTVDYASGKVTATVTTLPAGATASFKVRASVK